MRGRRPTGVDYVDRLAGSDQAKQRLKVVLATLTGQCRVQQACRTLGISEPRFQQLRSQILEAALERLEPRPAGRPPQTPPVAQQQVAALAEQLAAKEVELRAAQARAEIAVILPGRAASAAADTADAPDTAEKKTTQPRAAPPGRRRRRGRKKPT
jgi:helix-turn-helix protein